MTSQPFPGPPPPARIGLGRSNIIATIVVIVILLIFIASCISGGLGSTGSGAYVSYSLAVLFLAILVLVLVRMPKFVAPRFVLLDPRGLAIQRGQQIVGIPWSDIVGYGIGYAVADEEKAKIPTSTDALADLAVTKFAGAAAEALKISGKRQLALEIFPAIPDPASRYPQLKPYWQELPPPAPNLPAMRLRFPLPPVTSIAQEIANAMYVWSPQRFTGWFHRPWVGPKAK
jgi:hypothetical protein